MKMFEAITQLQAAAIRAGGRLDGLSLNSSAFDALLREVGALRLDGSHVSGNQVRMYVFNNLIVVDRAIFAFDLGSGRLQAGEPGVIDLEE